MKIQCFTGQYHQLFGTLFLHCPPTSGELAGLQFNNNLLAIKPIPACLISMFCPFFGQWRNVKKGTKPYEIFQCLTQLFEDVDRINSYH